LTFGPVAAVASALAAELGGHRPAAAQLAYRDGLVQANERAWQSVANVLGGSHGIAEPQAVRVALEALPPGGLLVVGNSLPIREVDAYVRATTRSVDVVCQRGANGIDGLIAGAAGAARAAEQPALLLLGDVDVSFAHDLGGLAAVRLVESPLAIVVIDNQGGRIFEQLPLERLFERDPERAALWLTPPDLAFEHAGPLFGLPYAAPQSLTALGDALSVALERRGASIVHVRVPPHGARDAQRAVIAELERALP
jgi:2-succinyl-5-enolpyruvyl-6-hydroxy-3-cyclohexene-1-carboxylate synthase